jgi:hypothetical protein
MYGVFWTKIDSKTVGLNQSQKKKKKAIADTNHELGKFAAFQINVTMHHHSEKSDGKFWRVIQIS